MFLQMHTAIETTDDDLDGGSVDFTWTRGSDSGRTKLIWRVIDPVTLNVKVTLKGDIPRLGPEDETRPSKEASKRALEHFYSAGIRARVRERRYWTDIGQ